MTCVAIRSANDMLSPQYPSWRMHKHTSVLYTTPPRARLQLRDRGIRLQVQAVLLNKLLQHRRDILIRPQLRRPMRNRRSISLWRYSVLRKLLLISNDRDQLPQLRRHLLQRLQLLHALVKQLLREERTACIAEAPVTFDIVLLDVRSHRFDISDLEGSDVGRSLGQKWL